MRLSPYRINDQTIREIQKEYTYSDRPWILGYSGGKDSSSLLKLVFLALLNLREKPKPVTVVYCDTGVEIPVVRDLAIKTLDSISEESQLYNIPLRSQIILPRINDRYFVKVIGRGYPTPSNKFRWCTERLRINPVNRVLGSLPDKKYMILLGVRHGESAERDRTIDRHKTNTEYYFRSSGNSNALIYSPIVNYTIEDVWNTLTFNARPDSIDVNPLFSLYKDASGECPIIRDLKGAPCAKGRFGCWVCTVVRKDHAIESMVKEGRSELKPLLDFRNWLVEIRDNPCFRWDHRRNGAPGLGPFTVETREEILKRLLVAQHQSGFSLILKEEIDLIKAYWEEDKSDTITSTRKGAPL